MKSSETGQELWKLPLIHLHRILCAIQGLCSPAEGTQRPGQEPQKEEEIMATGPIRQRDRNWEI